VIVVTGVAGFIGSQLADRLLADGHQVMGIDNLSRGTLENLSEALGHPGFRFVQADLALPESRLQALDAAVGDAPIDVIWHLAANSDIAAGVADETIDLRDTFMTTFNILQFAKRTGAAGLVFASTSAVYGVHPEPLAETHGPLLPISNYGAAKLAGEAVVSAAVETFLKRAWIFRFPNVVGPRATHGVINDLLIKLRANPDELEVLGDGSQQKPYLHVRELIEAMLFVVNKGGPEPRQLFNIGPDDDGFSVAGIVQTIVETTGTGARVRYTGGDRGWVGDVPRFSYSVDKLAKLGWRPSLSSADAIRTAVRQIATERGFA
jgi:UDP-glucose 4-epimerase